MGLGSDKMSVRMKASKKSIKGGDEEEVEMRGCWFGILSKCVAPKPKIGASTATANHRPQDVESNISSNKFSNISSNKFSNKSSNKFSNKSSNKFSKDQATVNVGISSSISVVESFTSTPTITEELKVSSQLIRFTFNELRSATTNFRPESIIGEGGFGRVYKGWVTVSGAVHAKSKQAVAVKTLNPDGLQGHREWLAEVYFLGDLHHPNLVKLIGYCMEDDQRMLVYEFMPRGSLENHLFRRSSPLPWNLRMKIAYGAAKGLAFLHERKRPVIYRDLKTSNILLDTDYNAKLSDFGLAKDGPVGDETHVSTRIMGTYGYAAPEYVMTGHLTMQSDVYSFGVVLLEMLSGRRSVDKSKPKGKQNLVEWAEPYLGLRHRYIQLIDRRLEGQFSIEGAERAVLLAARCLKRKPKTRPPMSEVVEALKSLQHLTDFAVSPSYFQTMQAERSNSNRQARNVATQQRGSPYRNDQVTRSPSQLSSPHGSPLSFPRGSPSSHGSPLSLNHPHKSPSTSNSRT